MLTHDMIATHPDVRGNTNDALIGFIDTAAQCATVCRICADSCLAEDEIEMLRQCIRLDLDCADVCDAAARLAARRTGGNEQLIRRMLAVCLEACRMCAQECRRHARHHDHCRICADACDDCAEACEDALQSMGGRRM